MNIELLADNTEYLPVLADWYEREWRPYYGADGPGDALGDLKARCNRDAVPIGFVARDDDHLYGVAALDLDAATKLTPSIVGLLVADEFRRKGIGAKLLRAAGRIAASLGHDRVYVSTTMLGDHLLRNGWRRIGDAEFLNNERGSTYVYDWSATGGV